MTDNETLIAFLRAQAEAANERAEAAEKRVAQWEHDIKFWGIIEIAARNVSVMDYMKHWEARAEAAEKALHELTEPISDAGHTTADGFRHELAECRKERDMLKAALERRGEIVFGRDGD